MAKKTIATNIFTDGDYIGEARKDLDQATWEGGVYIALKNLLQDAPFQSSQAVLQQIVQSGKNVLIRPAQPGTDHAEAVVGIDSFDYAARDWPGATPKDSPPLSCGAISGDPIFRKGDGWDPSRVGTGAGSNVCIYFTAEDHLKDLMAPGGRPDEILLHELVHALRMTRGLFFCTYLLEDYDSVEEFYAILIANIYRSECGKASLRANHRDFTNLADTDEARFYVKYKDKIDSFVDEPKMKELCHSIAAVQCRFNPIRRALLPPIGRWR
jgi:hypothetical protein